MTPPNIILILADQHRWDCVGFAGNPDIRTPNLDALAAFGVSFDQAICQYPASAPSRTTILTGLYPSRHGVEDNETPLAKNIPTLPELLKAEDYNTGCVGKMHFTPTRAGRGFDVMCLAEHEGVTRYEDDYHQWLHEEGLTDQVDVWDQIERDEAPQEYWDTFGAMISPLDDAHHSTTWIGNMALRFLQTAEEPFFLIASFIKPHHPFDPPEPWDALYAPEALQLPAGWRLPVSETDAQHGAHFDPGAMTEKDFRRVLAYYYANISLVDHQLGRLMATLTSRGFTNNVITYTADHGDYMGQHGRILKDAAPPYQSLLRVPLVIAGLAGQRRSQQEHAPAQLTDLMPTFLEVAGVNTPDSVQGKSLVSLLNRPGVHLRNNAYSEGPEGMRILREGRYKLISSPDPERRAFYDLENDPHEWDNLYGRPEAAAMQSRMARTLENCL